MTATPAPTPTPAELAAIAAAYALLRQRHDATQPKTPPPSRWRRAARLEAVGRADRDLR